MPERPKRRKNNKNKRKNNKNNRSDKNNIEENGTTSVESVSNIAQEDNVNQNNIEVINDCFKNLSEPCESLCLEGNSETPTIHEVKKVDESQVNEKSDISLVLPAYIVETPEQAVTKRTKLDNSMKSKSCDNDDSPIIVEITEDQCNQNEPKVCTSIIDSNNAIISNEESSIEWENVDDFKLPQTEIIKGIMSSTTIPLNIAHCEHTKILSPEEESSLRNYLQTLDLSTSCTNFNVGDIKTEIEEIINREIKYRLRRKGFAEDNIYPRAGPSRSLAVIDEEGSGESSKTSRRQSYLSDKKSDNEELEDEVFESKQKETINIESSNVTSKTTSKHLIPQQCLRVDAKIKEPEISEARGDWSVNTIEKITGAELVYLTDSSSSTSSIYDANDDFSKGEETDTSVRIITPTIEVTDTETLLSSNFATKPITEDANEIYENTGKKCKTHRNEGINSCEIKNDIKKCEFSCTDTQINGSSHEIVVLSTENLKTNLFVKDVEDNDIVNNQNEEEIKSTTKSSNDIDQYDLEIKVLKCELNDAINNLIKEVTSDSEYSNENSKDIFKRQDSSSSVDSSQCTAKYNPTNSSLNDVSNLIQDEECNKTIKENIEIMNVSSHVKDVLQSIASINEKDSQNKYIEPKTLRDLCLKKITSFPFGDKILEELANVSQRLQKTVLASQSKEFFSNKTLAQKENTPIPPPIKPRKSSLKISHDEQNKPLQSRSELVCESLSPSQKLLMEKTNTIIDKDNRTQITDPYICVTEEKKINDNKSINSVEKLSMKSKTGSRLLALLQNTSNSPKLNKTPVAYTNLPPLNTKSNAQSYSEKLIEEIDSTKTNFVVEPILSNNFKSLPLHKTTKTSTYYYESDSGIGENSFQTLSNSKKSFHYSTGNLNEEIENDISSIQNMHRYCTNLRDQKRENTAPRRPSLPKDLCDQQMEYICQKEKEVDAEIQRLEREKHEAIRHRGPKAPMFSEKDNSCSQVFDSKNGNYIKNVVVHQPLTHAERRKVSSLFSSSEEELLREKMYSEYVNQMAEREHRKQQKVIKITQAPTNINAASKSMPTLETIHLMNNRIEQEFISKAKERWYKLGITDPETEDEREKENNVYREPKIIEHKIKVIESGEEKDVRKLPSHMQDFVRFTVKDKEDGNGSSGESDSEQASAHVVVFCAVVILVLTVGKYLLRLLRKQ